jgi:pyruvate,orthophosphate dikinase
MVPLVSGIAEFDNQRAIIEATANQVLGPGGDLDYMIGTMIELPRAALTADEIAQSADFFSFGTNDLTQTTFGLSRDDAGRFLPSYIERGIFADDPFQTVDVKGVGRLMRMALEDGRRVRPKLKVGICGEHGGDPRSVRLCHDLGFDYVSCSPFRVPVARLAAAHAALGAN